MKENHHRELARYRMEKAYRNLSIARAAFQNGFFDEAVAKSYYAVLTAMRAVLAALHVDNKRHEGVITLFHQHLVNKDLFPKRYNKIISKLKRLRENADYGDYLSITEGDASQEIRNADEFVRTADEALAKLLLSRRGV
ncbi:MAG: HEPN domain-containing protein [Bacteroidota bacterium]